MRPEYEAPTYPGVGIPEPIHIPVGPMTIGEAARLLQTNEEGIVNLIAQGRLRRYDAGHPLGGVTCVHADDVARLLLARQQG